MSEEKNWKYIENIGENNKDQYMISNLGNVKSLKTNKTLKASIRSGYKSVWIGDKSHKIHRLVALAFVDNKDKKAVVNHKDGDKFNNCVDNLEWATTAENTKHGYDTGLNHTTKRAVHQLDMEEKIIKKFDSLKDARISTKIDDAGIVKVCKGYRKTAGGYKWKFADVNNNEVTLDLTNFVNINEFPNYKISNSGIVYSTRFKKILKQQNNADGYKVISLANNNIKKTFLVHRLVAEHFIKKIKDKNLVNHKDSNKSNNKVSNLEWVTNSENIIHANVQKKNKL